MSEDTGSLVGEFTNHFVIAVFGTMIVWFSWEDTMSSVRQALAVLLAIPNGTLHAQALRLIFPGKSLSMQAVLKAFDAQRKLVFVQVRPIDLLRSASNSSDLAAKWNSQPATSATLKNFASFLQPSGVSIAYVSKDGQTVALRGTNKQLLSINAIKLNDPTMTSGSLTQTGLANLAQGLAAGVGGGALFATSAAGLIFLGVVGFAAAGIFLFIGIYQLISASQRDEPPQPAAVQPPTTPGDSVSYSLADEVIGEIVDGIGTTLLNTIINLVGGGADGGVPDPGLLPGAGDLDPGDPAGGGGTAGGLLGFG